jgi:hypothetical protein
LGKPNKADKPKGAGKMNVKIKVYDMSKYEKGSKKVAEVEYNNIQGYEVVTGDRATEIGTSTDANSRDEFNEYLIITLSDGQTSTFCNSHVDIFRV